MKDKNFTLVYGFHSIIEILKANKRKLYELFLDKTNKKNSYTVLNLIEPYTKVTYIDKKKISFLCKTDDHQSIAAFVGPFVYQKRLINSKNKKDIILACNKIQDTRNLGALLRSAYCTGITSIIVESKYASEITGAVLKSSAGLAEYLCIYKTKNLDSDLCELNKEGYNIYLADAKGEYLNTIAIERKLKGEHFFEARIA